MPIKSLSQSSLLNFEKYSSLLAGNDAYNPVPPSSYDLLETEILTSSESSVTFSNLNSTYGANYQHLQLRMVTRDTDSDTGANAHFRINGVSTSSYSHHRLYEAVSYAGVSTTSIINAFTASANAPTGAFGAAVVDILDPFETTKNTTVKTLSGAAVVNGAIVLGSGALYSTAAVTSFQIFADASRNFVTGSRFSLYGLKKASA